MFEYKVISMFGTHGSYMEEELNHYGKQGWELIAITHSTTEIRCIFKRKKG